MLNNNAHLVKEALNNSFIGKVSFGEFSASTNLNEYTFNDFIQLVDLLQSSTLLKSLNSNNIYSNYNPILWNIIQNSSGKFQFLNTKTGQLSDVKPHHEVIKGIVSELCQQYLNFYSSYLIIRINQAKTLSLIDIIVPVLYQFLQQYFHKIIYSTIFFSKQEAITNLHYDASNTRLMIQLKGRKRFTFFHPYESLNLYPFPIGAVYERRSELTEDIEDISYTEDYPLFSKAQSKIVVLNPGQWVVFPSYWWHFVKSLDRENISLLLTVDDGKANLDS
jgi:hypothetical protein